MKHPFQLLHNLFHRHLIEKQGFRSSRMLRHFRFRRILGYTLIPLSHTSPSYVRCRFHHLLLHHIPITIQHDLFARLQSYGMGHTSRHTRHIQTTAYQSDLGKTLLRIGLEIKDRPRHPDTNITGTNNKRFMLILSHFKHSFSFQLKFAVGLPESRTQCQTTPGIQPNFGSIGQYDPFFHSFRHFYLSRTSLHHLFFCHFILLLPYSQSASQKDDYHCRTSH